MIKTLFVWLDANVWIYWSLGFAIAAVYGLWLGRAARRERQGAPYPYAHWWFAGLSLALILAWRWPVLFQATPFNPDEAQLLAAALTYVHDPLPFRSVDLTTSGPLNGLALIPTHLLGLPQDYFNARAVAMLLQWGTLLALFAALRRHTTVAGAACVLLPGTFFFATAADTDLVHYTSEHVSVFLVAIALLLLERARPADSAATARPGAGWIAGGIVLGLLPWAKLQSIPIGAAVALWGAALAWRDSRRRPADRLRWIGALAAATLAPSLLLLPVLAATGQFEQFRLGYLAANFHYVGLGDSWATVAIRLAGVFHYTWQVPALLGLAAVVLGAHVVLARKHRHPPRPLYWAAAGATVASVYAVFAPRHAFFHYLLLPLVPLILWVAVAALELRSMLTGAPMRRLCIGGFVAVSTLLPLGLLVRHGPPKNYGQFATDWRQPRGHLARHIRALARPGDRLALWGWNTHLYVETGLPQGTREAHSEHQLRASPLRDSFFRRTYLADLSANLPVFFVDAVGPTAFGYTKREVDGHETFPALREFIAAHYDLEKDFGYARLYVRADVSADRHSALPLVVPLTLEGFTKAEATGTVCRLGDAPPPPPPKLFYADQRLFGDLLPHPALDLFAHAPSRLVHPLPDGSLRLRGAAAFVPKADADPSNQTDGAVFSVRWISADGTSSPAWERQLAPASVAADRQPAPFDLVVPATATQVEFAIDSGATANCDWTYWHDLRLDVRYQP